MYIGAIFGVGLGIALGALACGLEAIIYRMTNKNR